MSSPKLSIIVPIYNVEAYLPACLESIAQQDFTDFEAILVNDGSPDGSAAIAEKFCKRDPRFKLINQVNGGLGRARNAGLAASTGEFVTFVDSDDLVTPQGHAALMRSLAQTGSDFASGGVQRLEDGVLRESPLHKGVFTTTRVRQNLSRNPHLLYDVTPWNKIFRRDFFLTAIGQWTEDALYEEIHPMTVAYLAAKTADIIAEPVYIWRDRSDGSSITQNRTEYRNLRDRFAAAMKAKRAVLETKPELLDFYLKKCISVDIKAYLSRYLLGDETYRKEVVDFSIELMDGASSEVEKELPIFWLGVCSLLIEKRADAVHKLFAISHNPTRKWHTTHLHGRHHLTLWQDEHGITTTGPGRDITDRFALKYKLLRIQQKASGVQLRGYAYIDRFPVSSPDQIDIFLIARSRVSGFEKSFRASPVYRSDLIQPTDAPILDYRWAGFDVRLPYRELIPLMSGDRTEIDIRLRIVSSGVTRETPLKHKFKNFGFRVIPGTIGIQSARLRSGDVMSLVLSGTKSVLMGRLSNLIQKKTKKPTGDVTQNSLSGARGAATLSGDSIQVKLSEPLPLATKPFLVKSGSLERFAMEIDPNDRRILHANIMAANLAPGTWAPLSPGKFTLQIVDDATTHVAIIRPTEESHKSVTVADMTVSVSPNDTFLQVASPLPDHEAGPSNQQRLREMVYAGARSKPVEPTILFESWTGQRIDDHPRAIYEELERKGAPFEKIFAVTDSSVPVPKGYKTVRRWTADYYSALGSASAIVTNNALTGRYARRPQQLVFQTWHGTPLKKIGLDIERVHFHNKNYVNELPEQVSKWDALLSPSPHVSEIYRRAFGFTREMVEIGSPRNDLLINERDTDYAKHLKTSLGIPHDARVVLYAPTWRDDSAIGPGKYKFDIGLDLKRIVETFPDMYILARGHQLLATSLVKDPHPRILDMTFYPDVRELYLMSNILISDYSSVLVDFSLLRRPIICYAPDYEKYRDVLRGFYIDFETEIPAPLITTENALIECLDDISTLRASYAEKYDEWIARYGSLEDGKASKRAADWLIKSLNP